MSSTETASSLIFIYMLSQKDKPAVADILKRYHETAIQNSAEWIKVGQEHGVIPAHVDAEKAARLLSIFKNGLQVQQIVSPDVEGMNEEDIFRFMKNALS